MVGSSTLLKAAGLGFVMAAVSVMSFSCGEDGTTSPKNTAPGAQFTITPPSGTTATDFQFDASGCSDAEDASSSLEVRWDWENDGIWDTSYSTTKTATHRYGTTGTKTIKLEVKDTGDLTGETTQSLVVNALPSPPDMVLVPAGAFTMGDGSAYGGLDEHEVTLTRAFDLGQHEVTNQEYMEALQWAYDNGYVTVGAGTVQDNLDDSTEDLLDLSEGDCEIQFDGAGSFYLRESPSSAAQSAYPGGYDPSDHPVMEVSWYGAARYCDWLSMQAGLPRAYEHAGAWACNGGDPYGAEGYRLPTDAEWERAARYDDERLFPWGGDYPTCDVANLARSGFCVGWTSPVGSYADAPASLGLSDMAGNVFEWCNDWYESRLGTSAVTDPTGPGSGDRRVYRGGSWSSQAFELLCAGRYDFAYPADRSNVIGLRVSKTANP
jgi:formylglycine-generating enzyme required for sulfatase activity